MPIYEYKCGNCDHEFEIIQKFSDKPKRKCPECKRQRLKKMVSKGSSFRLNGPHWDRRTAKMD